MQKDLIPGRNGYDIPFIGNATGTEKLAVIVIHGFGGSKDGSSTTAAMTALPARGIAAFAFDLPAHGESKADGGMLRIGNCLNDLAAVEAHVCGLLPQAEVAYFASSFGAYIALIYLAARAHAGRRAFLRCAAVNMPGLFRRAILPEQYAQFKAQGFFMLDMEVEGYLRPLKITQGFLDDLDAHDVFKLCRPGMAQIAMVHGTADEIASVDDARRFATQFGAALTEIEGADHSFTVPGGMDTAMDAAVRFFTAD